MRTVKKSDFRREGIRSEKPPKMMWKLDENLQLIGHRCDSARILDGRIRFSEALLAHILISLREKEVLGGIGASELLKIANSAPSAERYSIPSIYKTLDRLKDVGLVNESIESSPKRKKPSKKYSIADSVEDETISMIRNALNLFREREKEIKEWKKHVAGPLSSIECAPHNPMRYLLVLQAIFQLLDERVDNITRYLVGKKIQNLPLGRISPPSVNKLIDKLSDGGILNLKEIGKRIVIELSETDREKIQQMREWTAEYVEIEKKYDCYF